MSKMQSHLQEWVIEIASLISTNADPEFDRYISFLKEPAMCLELVDLIDAQTESSIDEEDPMFSACIFAMDICVAQLQEAHESGNKLATKSIQQLMATLAKTINTGQHTLGFWLPILNAFYEAQLELSVDLQEAYFNLANQEDPEHEIHIDDGDHLKTMREMIAELSDLSVFDIAENFFAQSHAMPASFFADFIVDLYSIEEGQDIGLLALMHPNREVRETVLDTLAELIHTIVLSPISLSRLQAIKNYYPSEYHEQFQHFIKIQRKKGVVFHKEEGLPIVQINASEVDGSGAQGLFIHFKNGRLNRLAGLLFKRELGIKDAWLTPYLSGTEIKKYYKEAFNDRVTLRKVDKNYVVLITEHFLALSLAQGNMPDLHFLEIQELLGFYFMPNALDIDEIMQELSIQVAPFTASTMQESFKRSKLWLKNKQFTESWYIENANVDKLVNRCSSFVDGVKVCSIQEAIPLVFEQEMEVQRNQWMFHFLWISLWLKAGAYKNEKLWQDSFILSYAIYTGLPLKSIPVLEEIVYQTVVNSVETMIERRTHLSKE